MKARTWRLRVDASQALLGGSFLFALVLGYVLASRGAKIGIEALAAVFLAVWLTRRPGNGLLLATAMLWSLPYWYHHIWLIGPCVAVAGLVTGIKLTPVRGVDIVVFLLVAVMAASWLFHRQLGVPPKTFVQYMLPFGYYFLVRVTISDRLLSPLQWVLLLAAGAGALTVLYESARGVPILEPPQLYEWAGSSTTIFRAGGIFGGPPAAATCLALALLSTAAIYRHHPKAVLGVGTVIIAAIIVTFDRAGLLALAVGTVVLAILLPYRHWGRVAFVALAVSIPVYAVITSSNAGSLSSSRLVSQAVLRSSTISARLNLASLALPLLHAPTSEIVFGRGFDSLFAHGFNELAAPPAPVDHQLASVPTLLNSGGPNDEYLRALLEQGLLGLVLVVSWLAGSALLGVRTCMRLPRRSTRRMLVAGLTASVVAYAAAAIGHDMTHNWVSLSIAGLITGTLVSVCSLTGMDEQKGTE